MEAVLQGIIQGFTEFLPVSSSGHLSLFQYFTGGGGDSGALFGIALHLGTLFAVVIAFWGTIYRLLAALAGWVAELFSRPARRRALTEERAMILMLIVSLLPLVFTLLFRDFYERFAADRDIVVEGVCFLITGTLLFFADRCVKGQRTARNMALREALIIGLTQAVLAPLPGLSRSGSTLAVALLLGLSREFSVMFSFLMGAPTIAAAVVLSIPDILADPSGLPLAVVAAGVLVSALFGIVSIWMVRWLVRSDRLCYFSWYTWGLGAAVAAVGTWEHLAGYPVSGFVGSLLH